MVFLFQKSFFLIKISLNHFNFLVKFNIFHKKGSICSKNSKNKNTYTLLNFDTQASLSTVNYNFEFIIMVQRKVIDLINLRLDAKTFEFLSCYMSYLVSNLIFCLKNFVKK